MSTDTFTDWDRLAEEAVRLSQSAPVEMHLHVTTGEWCTVDHDSE